MAFISQLDSAHIIFTTLKKSAAHTLYAYLKEALTPQSEIYTRILGTYGECKFEIGEGMIAIEQSYTLKAESSAFFESHQRYIDFQLRVQGEELFYIAHSQCATIHTSYNPQKDLSVWDYPSAYSILHFMPRTLGVFMPYDIHAGGLGAETLQIERVYKSVVKVPIEILIRH
ncbi:YhcH/YjgK/YiaL family protein [uncultured Helicobacter sp.]|uniref:YhcH/YjgK/YiaL family protein n=1 Tax=uncultured Helicobacter sp. TaxID=175537 RepID=UPI002597FC56|nr:YhcH/YjgK/YiaL family protein [uncultured Helicobacter sp.]